MSAFALPRERVPRAPWTRVLGGLLLGELLTTALLALPAVGLAEIHVLPRARLARGLAWPYAFDGAWSVLTDVTVLAALAALGAAGVALALFAVTGRPTSFGRTTAILLLTGGAPFAWGHGLVTNHVLGVVVATVALRAYAVGRRDAVSRRVLTAVCAPLLVAALGYAALHPLSFGGFATTRPRTLFVASASPFAVHVTDVVSVAHGTLPTGLGLRAGGFRLPRNVPQLVVLRQPACGRVTGTAVVDQVVVRYRVLGLGERQVLTLATPIRVACP